jgi:hypothetical protein
MKSPIVACLGAVFLSVFSGHAQAAIWAWGCQGQFSQQLVIFNRDTMYVVDGKLQRGKARDAIEERISELAKGEAVAYDPQNTNEGFESKTLEFTRHDDPKKKIVLTEQSSRRISHRARLICGRDDILDIFQKVYRYQHEDDPPRNVTMQCFDYLLSTRGGRKGCD